MSNYLMTRERLDQIAWEMFREIQIGVISSLADENGLGISRTAAHVEYRGGTAIDLTAGNPSASSFDSSRWVFPDSVVQSVAPDMDLNQEESHAEIEVVEEGKIDGLISVDHAKKAIEDELKKMLSGVKQTALRKSLALLGLQKPGSYRWELFSRRFHFTASQAGQSALEKISEFCFRRKGRRRGVVKISTRKNVPLGWFQYSGMRAFRAHRGRPILSKSDWLKRYRSRRNLKNKTKNPSAKQRAAWLARRTITPPPTRNVRPARTMNLKRKNKSGDGWYQVSPADVSEQIGVIDPLGPGGF